MSSYDGFASTTPAHQAMRDVVRGQLTDAPGANTTYCYREAGGTRGTTTNLSAVPAGAEIERTVTS